MNNSSLKVRMPYCTWIVFEIFKVHTKALGFTDIFKHSKKSKLFSMCGSQVLQKFHCTEL